MVSDNAANITKAITNYFGKEKHIPCFAHTLNLVAQNAMDNFHELSFLITKVKEIVKFFKHSVVGADELRKAQGANAKKLLQSVATRWNSTYYLLLWN